MWDDIKKQWFILAKANIGPVTTLKLIKLFETPENIIKSKPKDWKNIAKLNEPSIEKLLNAINSNIDKEIDDCIATNIKLITIFDNEYPTLLKSISSPPAVLFVKGKLPSETLDRVAIVGSRDVSEEGKKTAYKLGYGLAKNDVVTVSGMALGIDGMAHAGTIRGEGKTIAILGSGVNYIYPKNHKKLYHSIIENGAVISEMMPYAPPTRHSFPIRNRIISGLSLGVVVVEAQDKSGALITVDHALAQGRDVFAVPTSYNENNHATNTLIKDGAKIVENANDIIEEIRTLDGESKHIKRISGVDWNVILTETSLTMDFSSSIETKETLEEIYNELDDEINNEKTTAQANTTEQLIEEIIEENITIIADESKITDDDTSNLELLIYNVLDNKEKSLDEIILLTKKSAQEVSVTLLTLELNGQIIKRPTGKYIKYE